MEDPISRSRKASHQKKILLGDTPLSPEMFVSVTRDNAKVVIGDNSAKKVIKCRKIIENVIASEKIVYGVTTGFGAFKNKKIEKDKTKKLQENLILSHAVGVGKYFPKEIVRGIMLLIANYLLKGYSGVKLETIKTIVTMINKGVTPQIPEKGSVGSSGDLAPSAHMALVLIGKGEAEYKGKIVSGAKALRLAGIKPVTLEAKEGLGIINNTAAMTSIGGRLIRDTRWLLNTADICASLSLQALGGTDRAYDPKIHRLKPHRGQVETARNLCRLLKGSNLLNRDRVQEAYSFRCVPQIHGAVREAFFYAKKVIETEMGSVTDNPLIFNDSKNGIISGGNFHGEPVAIALDTLGIALSEIGNVSDRRIAALFDPANSNGLPAFLTTFGGINSGLMILQYTTASLVSENKILSHPASVDSIPTSANIEDLVSMGTIAARKAAEIFENVENILAIELFVSCQGIDLRIRDNKDLRLSPKTEKVYKKIRAIAPFIEKDTIYYDYVREIKNNLEEICS